MNPDLPPSTPLGETVAADAAVAQAGDSHSRHSAGNTHCLNCGTKLAGPYCSACGQHDFDFHRSFGHVFLEALENIFHFDGKFFRNIVTLLFVPGRLTAEFNAGKRAGQVPPFRLYIFTAFVFFLWFFSTNSSPDALRMSPAASQGSNTKWMVDGQPVTREQAMKARNDPAYAAELKKEIAAELERHDMGNPAAKRTVDRVRELAEQRTAEQFARKDAEAGKAQSDAKTADKNERQQSDFEKWIEAQGRRSMDPALQKEMARAFIGAIPKMLLFCLPFFALYTRVLFRKSGQVYLQHLILALHFHTYIFLWLMFRDGWVFLARQTGLGLHGWVAFAGNAWLALYPLLMLRRLFANSWKRTLLKTLVLALGYTLTLAVAFGLTALVVFLLM